jgi:hypothetical protein
MDTQESDKEDIIPTIISRPSSAKSNKVDVSDIEQGTGSNLNSDTVDGIQANSKPSPNCLVPLNDNGHYPTSTLSPSIMIAMLWGS